ncbi:hypothetical protein DFH06DRAFT_729188 [Mycena polygramma]|nr:hypothetical protein DFH06DRAFT_729188 [Mycena polygramma]
MIPLRNALRSSSRLESLGITCPRLRSPQLRPYHQSSPLSSFPGARRFFRADGTTQTRSKGPGLVIPLSLALLSVFAYVNRPPTMIDSTWVHSDQARLLLSILANIQRIDKDYASVSFDSYRSSVDYFVQLWACAERFCRSPERSISAEIGPALMLLENEAEVRDPVHVILRDAVEKVHGILASIEDSDDSEVMFKTVLRLIPDLNAALEEAFHHLACRFLVREALIASLTASEEPAKDGGKCPEILG